MRRQDRDALDELGHYALDGRDHEHAPSSCGKCGGLWTTSTGKAGQPLPQPGAFCVCALCGAICQYSDDMQGKPVTDKELRQLPRSFRRKLEDLSRSLSVVDRLMHERWS